MFRPFATAFMTLAMTAPAIAAEPGGTITGTIDGQQVELSISPGQSDYSGSLEDRWISVSLVVYDRALAQRDIGTVFISFEGFGEVVGDEITLMEVQAYINDTSPARSYYAEYSAYAEENPLAQTVTSVTEAGNLLTVSGTVTGTLTSVERMGLRNPDPDDTLEIDLSFDAVVVRLDGE